MKKSKTVKKSIAIFMVIVISVIMVATSVVTVALVTDRKSDNSAYLADAKNVVTNFVYNENYNNYAFMDGLFSKADIVSACVNEQTNSETATTIAKNLGLNSFVVTDAEGKIITSTDVDKIGKSMLDYESTKQFIKVLKGITYKTTTEPTAIEGESGMYNVMACVTRSGGGVVIIDIDTDTYTSVTGENLAQNCIGETIIAKNGKIISTNLDISGISELESLGITDEMINNKDFEITIDNKNYTLVADNIDEYVVISGAVEENSVFSYQFGALISAIECAVMIIISIVVFNLFGRKKNN